MIFTDPNATGSVWPVCEPLLSGINRLAMSHNIIKENDYKPKNYNALQENRLKFHLQNWDIKGLG